MKLLKSSQFLDRLEHINYNYPNLKQECVIRNSVLELLNDYYLPLDKRAFAEHPREGSKKVDLSIFDKSSKRSFCIEFKFQYTNDFGQFKNYKPLLDNDFTREVRKDIQCDIFVLIVSHWDALDKKEYDLQWGLHSDRNTLSRYLSKDDKWKENIRLLFKDYEEIADKEVIELTVSKPYFTHYSIHIIYKKTL